MAPVTVDRFLRCVLRSGLLGRDELQSALRDVPKPQRSDPEALAEHLVRSGKLSRFQADKLLRGASRGLLLGHYQVLAPIGRGGMGTVYLARHQRGGQLLALKVLSPKRAHAEERLLARFRREMILGQLVSHPHLCRTYEVGEDHGVHYIAMEFVPGKTLSRIVNESGPLPVPRIAHLLAEVASGLAHAHGQALIHRDLKPSNIQVTPHDHAKVLDLGLALLQGERGDVSVVGGQGYILGTMDYIAPEQTTDASRVDGRADLYSLGCVLYFALTGAPPFPGGTSKEKVQRQRHEKPRPLAELRPDLPAGFVGLVERLMSKSAADRPANAGAVEAELRAWALGVPEQPLDPEGGAAFTESVVLLQRAGPAEDGTDDLPELEEDTRTDAEPLGVEVGEEPTWSPWLVGALAVGVGLLALLLAIALVAVWWLRR
jgi:serine/threonine protein kinase